ncbi:MAG TPA: SMP-30/gluconolactonase/LRE family protein [Gemmataceae bacterium]|nr:SMP-30/gluconolactonase/LRE family protein [Gemmataceae bacterium]
MRWQIALVVVSLSGFSVFAADVPAPTGAVVVPEGAKLELLFTRSAKIKGGLTEGPACAPDGSIYFSDIPIGSDKGLIMRFNPKTKTTIVFEADSYKSNGLKFDAQGRLVACEGADGGGRCVSRYDVNTGQREVLADRFMGKRFNAPNDLVIDRKGRIYFSDPKYLGPEKRELEHMAVYRIDTDGTVVEVTHDASKPNGVALSPDEKTLYVINHDNLNERLDIQANPVEKGPMTVYTFPLGPDGLVSGKRFKLIDVSPRNGFDGMCVDEKGNLYLALRDIFRPGVLVTGPNGHEIAFIPTGAPQPNVKEPVGIPSNVCFGAGGEKSTLYITVDTSLYRIKLKIPANKHVWEK